MSLSSSSDENGNDDDNSEGFSVLETPVKRRRYRASLDTAAKSGESLDREGVCEVDTVKRQGHAYVTLTILQLVLLW